MQVKLNPKDSSSEIKLNSLTSVRGLCVLLVIGAHLLPYLAAPKTSLGDFGNSGVIGFFTLSSFLICKSLFNSNFSYKRFLIRRVIRIYPLFIINFVIFTIVLNLLNRNEIDHLEINLFHMSEWFLLIGNYNVTHDTPFSHLWSVCVEMHFYLCLPLLALINNKLRSNLLFFLIIFSCGLNFYMVNNLEIDNIWKLSTSHLSSFCVGALLATHELKFLKFDYSREMLIVLIPSLMFFSSNNGLFYTGRWSGVNYLLLSIMYALILLMGLKHPSKKYSFFHFLGERSYSIYLTHFTVIAIFMAEFNSGLLIQAKTATPQQVTICFIMMILIGSLEYSIFERRILKLKTKIKFIET